MFICALLNSKFPAIGRPMGTTVCGLFTVVLGWRAFKLVMVEEKRYLFVVLVALTLASGAGTLVMMDRRQAIKAKSS